MYTYSALALATYDQINFCPAWQLIAWLPVEPQRFEYHDEELLSVLFLNKASAFLM